MKNAIKVFGALSLAALGSVNAAAASLIVASTAIGRNVSEALAQSPNFNEKESIQAPNVECYVEKHGDKCPEYTNIDVEFIAAEINNTDLNAFLAPNGGSFRGNCHGVSYFLMKMAEMQRLKEGLYSLKKMADCARFTRDIDVTVSEETLIQRIQFYRELLTKPSPEVVYQTRQDLLDLLYPLQIELGESMHKQISPIKIKYITFSQTDQFDVDGRHKQTVNLKEDTKGDFLDELSQNKSFLVEFDINQSEGGHVIFCQKIEDMNFLVVDTFSSQPGYNAIMSKPELLEHLNGSKYPEGLYSTRIEITTKESHISPQTIATGIYKSKKESHKNLTLAWLKYLPASSLEERVRLQVPKDSQLKDTARFVNATLFGVAVLNKNPELANEAFQKGANPNQTILVYDAYDRLIEGIKPIDLAKCYGDSETVDLLLDEDDITHIKEDL